MTKISTVLIDMDEVLVDFVGGACRIHGTSRERMEAERNAGSLGIWDISSPLGYATGLGRAMTLSEFWKPIHDAGETFWRDLQPTPWLGQLVDIVETAFGPESWHVISAPSRLTESYTGKVRWLKSYFGPGFDRFAITPHKHLFARDNRVLVDDRESNCDAFSREGGQSILFPSRGGPLWAYADNPLSFVEYQLKQLTRS